MNRPGPGALGTGSPAPAVGIECRLLMTLWHGRLGGGTAEEVMAFSVSLHFDRSWPATTSPGRVPMCVPWAGAASWTPTR